MRCFLAVVSLLVLAVCGLAADWPAWRGPDRTGVSKETGLLKKWPDEGPKLVWQSNKAGRGYAGIAVVGGIVYTMGARDNVEFVLAFDSKEHQLVPVRKSAPVTHVTDEVKVIMSAAKRIGQAFGEMSVVQIIAALNVRF